MTDRHTHLSARSIRGFTLIELLVVIAIIGILSSVVMVLLVSATDNAKLVTARATAKSVQEVARACLYDNVSICLPGAQTGGCTASVSGDTQNGGGHSLCSSQSGAYVELPNGWVWCDGTPTGSCAPGLVGPPNTQNTVSQQTTSQNFNIRIKRTSDYTTITCTETGCSCVSNYTGECPAN
jgi:prepilin-type N-terminal cleavage/methylation domain-containing protein